ncbi:class I SAM-dependent methyltransferase [Desulfoscipio sp. XC116]|uniref:class I SAM-dependent methyltransferase n=1 Tax=Desulfoscipio sp. XC116 TaxID=3144975 RepID=UPI00325B1207
MENDLDILSAKAVILIVQNKLQDAEGLLLAGLELDSKHFDLLFNLGYVYEQKLEYQKALNIYKDAKDVIKTDKQSGEVENAIRKLESLLNASKKTAYINSNIPNIDPVSNEESLTKQLKEKKVNIKQYFKEPDDAIKKRFRKKEHQAIIKIINEGISKRNYAQVISICNYWINQIDAKSAYIYYFLAVAANGIGGYENALTFHKTAMELDSSLADIRNKQSKYIGNYRENQTSCIGCGFQGCKIVNVTNQSISEDNKEMINPIRIWVKCQKCGLVYANPMPEAEVLNQYYSIIAKEKSGGIYGDIGQRFEFLVKMANKRLEKIERHWGGVGTLLDVGTGIGVFVGTAMDRGWDANGLELTPDDCVYAAENFGLTLLQQDLYTCNFQVQYDVVTFFEVIEHLRSPQKDLKRINQFIKENGILVVATPILDSMFGKKEKDKNVFWNVVTHLSYFTKDVLTNYLMECGFEILEISTSDEGMGRMEYYCRKMS